MGYKINSKSLKFITVTISFGILAFLYFKFDNLHHKENHGISLSSQVINSKIGNGKSMTKACIECKNECIKGFNFKNQIEKCVKTMCKNCPKIKILEKKQNKKIVIAKYVLIAILFIVIITSIALIIIETNNYKENENNGYSYENENNMDLFARLNENSLIEI